MKDLSKITPIQLQKLGNDIKAKHDALKQEIITLTFDMEELEKKLNEKAIELQELEKNYVEIVEKLME